MKTYCVPQVNQSPIVLQRIVWFLISCILDEACESESCIFSGSYWCLPWYKNQPLGVNILSDDGSKYRTNWSFTTITYLVQSKIYPLHVAQLSGHKY